MLKMRLGDTPVTEVNTPWPLAASTKYRSSQKGKIVLLKVLVGRQTFEKVVLALTNCKLPFELTLALLYGAPYRLYVNGSAMLRTPSSTCRPMLVVPGSIVP